MPLTQVQGGMLQGSTNTTTTIQSNGTTAITIDSSQNVGIGTTSPAVRLDVTGSGVPVTINSTNNSNVLRFSSASTVGGFIGSSGTNLLFSNNSGTETMRITNTGLVGIGTGTPSAKLGVTTSVAAEYSGYFTFINTGYGIGVRNSSGGASDLMFFFSPNYVGSISSNGTGTSFITASDYRLKEDIAPMSGALDKVALLKPVTYKWKSDGTDGQGFIAHELQEVVPDCVTGEKDAVETYTDEDGNEQTRIKPQGVDTSFLVATLTAAIQELKAELDATKAEVAALKAAP